MTNEGLENLLSQLEICREQLHSNESMGVIEVFRDILSFKIVLWDGTQRHHIEVACSLTALEHCRIDLLVAVFEHQLEKLREIVADVG